MFIDIFIHDDLTFYIAMFIDINSISIDDDDVVVTTDSKIQNSRIDKRREEGEIAGETGTVVGRGRSRRSSSPDLDGRETGDAIVRFPPPPRASPPVSSRLEAQRPAFFPLL